MSANNNTTNNYESHRGFISRVLMLIAAVLFVLAAFAVGGHDLANVPAWAWAFGGLASWALAGAA
jgi:hypothetical protein